MPLKKVNTTLGQDGFKPKYQADNILSYLSNLNSFDIANVHIDGKNAEISMEMSGWKWFRELDLAMATRLNEERLEQFFQKTPGFLKTSYGGSLDFSLSRPLGYEGKERFSFMTGIMPGFAESKNAQRNKECNTFVATAYFPTPERAYSGTSLDGFWIHNEIDESLFGKYLRLATEAEKLGFATSKIWPKKGQCMQGVCIHPWQMEKEETVDFTRAMMQKEETEELIVSDSAFGDAKRGGREKAYEFRARVFPKTYNVEVALVGSPRHVGSILGIVGKSLDLLSIELRGEDKISYMKFYQEENKTAEAVADAFATAGGAVSASFSKLGRGFKYVGGSMRNVWRDYQNGKRRKTEEILQEVKGYGLEPNAGRTQSCLYAWNKECIVNSVQKKKAEKTQPTQSTN
jgi:hypothetical protein